MKRYLLSLTALFVTLTIVAQPSWVKKATKAVFTLKTFTADGTLLASSTGFFVAADGAAVSSYAPFRGASRAVIIDAAGKELPVVSMLGANETYDVAKFRVDVKKPQVLTLSVAQPGQQVWMLPYHEVRQVPQGVVRKAEQFNGHYDYYTVAIVMPDNSVGAPLLNDAGDVVGIMQQAMSSVDTLSYAVSALYADSLRITGLSINDPALRAVNIKKALPADYSQAQLTVYLAASQLDSASYAQLIDDFIAQYPDEADGYIYRAQLATTGRHYDAADRDMATAIDVAKQPDDAHYSYSRLIHQKLVTAPADDYAPWTFQLAQQEAERAYAINPLPVYRQQQANVLFADKQYQQACAIYEELTATSLRSADLFVDAARCKVLMADTLGQLAMLDSAVATFSRPYLKEASPYILARAQAREAAGRHREAVVDFNDYEQLNKAQLNDYFYYIRYQSELNGRLYQQALNDISQAVELNPRNEFYYSEKASLEVRVGYYDQAIETAQACIRLMPDFSDGYLFLGVAQCLKGQTAEGVKNLQRAHDLGDEQAADLIKKYAK